MHENDAHGVVSTTAIKASCLPFRFLKALGTMIPRNGSALMLNSAFEISECEPIPPRGLRLESSGS